MKNKDIKEMEQTNNSGVRIYKSRVINETCEKCESMDKGKSENSHK